MTKEECERWWRIYGHQFFSNPPVDPTFEDLYQAIYRRLFDEHATLKHFERSSTRLERNENS